MRRQLSVIDDLEISPRILEITESEIDTDAAVAQPPARAPRSVRFSVPSLTLCVCGVVDSLSLLNNISFFIYLQNNVD